MPVSVNITKKEYVFIDPETGEILSPKQFDKKYRAVNLGGHRENILGKGTEK